MKYADAGVNIAVAEEAKQCIRHHASRTFTPGVLGGIGSFGALFARDHKKWKEPVLVASADGVGTKLKVAMAMGVHSPVGGDLVNHCINDILVRGAEPLFFLDFLAMGKLEPQVVEQLVEGMSRSCRKAGCALIGGGSAGKRSEEETSQIQSQPHPACRLLLGKKKNRNGSHGLHARFRHT